MKLEGARSAYLDFSGLASDVSRQASFAGIALIWIFKTDSSLIIALPAELQLPALLFVMSLSFDLLHYVSGALVWGFFNRLREFQMGKDSDEDIRVPVGLNFPTLLFFWLKLFAVIAGYFVLLSYLIDKINFY